MFKSIKYFGFLFVWFMLLWITFSADRDLPGIEIISRKQRWADESIRYTEMSIQDRRNINEIENQEEMEYLRENNPEKYREIKENEYKSQMANDYLKENYGQEIDLDWSNYESDWNYLLRPEYIHQNKTKIIVHHTASDISNLKSKADVLDYLSGVYRYHTIERWRWDIWYNFIIDPFWNIYEGRAGWEWVVWAHAKRNNTPSIWISLIWNFNNIQPTKQSLNSLVSLVIALSKKYNINPYSRTDYHKDSKQAPYLVSQENYVIAGHKDAWITSCPWVNLYKLLPAIRENVKKWLEWKTLTSISSSRSSSSNTTSSKKTKLTYEYFQSLQTKISPAVVSIKKSYTNKNNISSSNQSLSKLLWKIDIQTAKNYLQQDISVLLYELTQDYTDYDISCQDECFFIFDNNKINSQQWVIKVWESLELYIMWKKYLASKISVFSKDNTVQVNNYDRESYAWVPRNSFNGSLIFKKDYMKDIDWNQEYKYVVINKLNFQDYLKWIVETNDTESDTKNKVMTLISKSYALFYMNPENQHPNIPQLATYNAVDDSRIFQKYVWAWLQKTLKKRFVALEQTKDQLITYNNSIVVLPYFSCSAGFTYSAKEKRWWNDTNYLQTKFDPGICKDKSFNWHWVWLSGLWAERRSKFWRSYSDIIQYYFPWVEVVNI